MKKLREVLASSNFWVNISTIGVGIVLAFIQPDLTLSGEISSEVVTIVGAVKAANYGLLITGVFNLGNIIFHLFKKPAAAK